MNTLEAIAQRYSCRNFTDQVPSEECLKTIVQAGIQAPSGMNRQPWQFIVITSKSLIQDMDQAGMQLISTLPDQSLYERLMTRGGTLFYHAPCMIMIAIQEASLQGAELIDLGIAAQNISLAATALGIDNLHCGLAVIPFTSERASEFKQRIQFPQGYGCGMAVLLGYSKEKREPHVPDPEKITWIK